MSYIDINKTQRLSHGERFAELDSPAIPVNQRVSARNLRQAKVIRRRKEKTFPKEKRRVGRVSIKTSVYGKGRYSNIKRRGIRRLGTTSYYYPNIARQILRL